MLLRRIEEIETILDLLHADRILVRVVLQNELLEVEESALVIDLLAHLNQRFPGVLGCQSSAFRALRSLDHVLDLEDLLQNRG